jgi:hypothetical protein
VVHARVTLLAAALALISCHPGAESLTFQAKVSNLHRRNNSLATNKRPDDLVELTLPGHQFQPPIAVNTVERGDANWSSPEQAISSILSANIAGNVPWMIDSFLPAERDEARKQLSDPIAARRTQDYFRNLGKIEMTGRAEIGGFTVISLRGLDPDGDVTFLTMVLSKTPSGWRQTNALADDEAFDVVQTAMRTGGVR